MQLTLESRTPPPTQPSVDIDYDFKFIDALNAHSQNTNECWIGLSDKKVLRESASLLEKNLSVADLAQFSISRKVKKKTIHHILPAQMTTAQLNFLTLLYLRSHDRHGDFTLRVVKNFIVDPSGIGNWMHDTDTGVQLSSFSELLSEMRGKKYSIDNGPAKQLQIHVPIDKRLEAVYHVSIYNRTASTNSGL